MSRFRRLFALLFVLSVFVTVVHELGHHHGGGEECEVCLLAHSPALIDHSEPLIEIGHLFDPYPSPPLSLGSSPFFAERSRSPPVFLFL